VCVCVCVCVCVYIYIYIYTHTHTIVNCVCVCVCVFTVHNIEALVGQNKYKKIGTAVNDACQGNHFLRHFGHAYQRLVSPDVERPRGISMQLFVENCLFIFNTVTGAT